MPLQKGKNSMGGNMRELMKPAQSLSRRRAIATIARKHGISMKEAQYRQAQAISEAQARKR